MPEVMLPAWPVLRDGCDAAVSVSDDEAQRAVADLASFGLSSGPSGASTLAGVRTSVSTPERREAVALSEDCVIVLLSTEGDLR